MKLTEYLRETYHDIRCHPLFGVHTPKQYAQPSFEEYGYLSFQ